jgi:hypothetical protein
MVCTLFLMLSLACYPLSATYSHGREGWGQEVCNEFSDENCWNVNICKSKLGDRRKDANTELKKMGCEDVDSIENTRT